jgi:GTP-binding protein Era
MPQKATEAPSDTRCGFAAIIGAPNAGKSTLVNTLVGQKVSIVTPKVQTTRARIRGIAMRGDTQIIFVDTPGIFAPRRLLDEAMVEAAWEGANDADVICLLVDAARESAEPEGMAAKDTQRIIEGLREGRRKAFLVLNKIDEMPRPALLELAKRLHDPELFSDVFMISASKGDGVQDLLAAIAKRMKPGPWLYPPDQTADIQLRQLAAEITREKLFMRLHEELPYSSTVETEEWKTMKDGSARIEQTIYVERDGQKGIVIGKNGTTLKDIGAKARADMEAAFGHRVHLFLFVKVRGNWAEDPQRLREIGLELPKKKKR